MVRPHTGFTHFIYVTFEFRNSRHSTVPYDDSNPNIALFTLLGTLWLVLLSKDNLQALSLDLDNSWARQNPTQNSRKRILFAVTYYPDTNSITISILLSLQDTFYYYPTNHSKVPQVASFQVFLQPKFRSTLLIPVMCVRACVRACMCARERDLFNECFNTQC